MTSWQPAWLLSRSLSHICEGIGGSRTRDLSLHEQTLNRLSYAGLATHKFMEETPASCNLNNKYGGSALPGGERGVWLDAYPRGQTTPQRADPPKKAEPRGQTTTCKTLPSLILWDTIMSSRRETKPRCFSRYVLVMMFVMVNMFVTIINDTFAAVQHDIAKQSNDYEIVEFMLQRLEQLTGLPVSKLNSLEKYTVSK